MVARPGPRAATTLQKGKPMKTTAAFWILSLLWVGEASAQASEKAMQICRETTRKIAGDIGEAQKKRLDMHELERDLISRMHDTWARGVVVYMIQTAIDAPRMSEREIATLGYAYCIERRPAGT